MPYCGGPGAVGIPFLDDSGSPLELSSDGTLVKVWNFAELDAALLDAEERILRLERSEATAHSMASKSPSTDDGERPLLEVELCAECMRESRSRECTDSTTPTDAKTPEETPLFQTAPLPLLRRDDKEAFHGADGV